MNGMEQGVPNAKPRKVVLSAPIEDSKTQKTIITLNYPIIVV